MKNKIEVVFIPSAQHARDPGVPIKGYSPGGRFKSYTSEAIRLHNIARYKATPFQQAKAAAVSSMADEIMAALHKAQGSSLAHRGYGRAVAA